MFIYFCIQTARNEFLNVLAVLIKHFPDYPQFQAFASLRNYTDEEADLFSTLTHVQVRINFVLVCKLLSRYPWKGIISLFCVTVRRKVLACSNREISIESHLFNDFITGLVLTNFIQKAFGLNKIKLEWYIIFYIYQFNYFIFSYKGVPRESGGCISTCKAKLSK